METSESSGGAWVDVLNGPVRLRCWWAEPQAEANDIESELCSNRVYIVLPEVFGLNAWVRSVVDRLADKAHLPRAEVGDLVAVFCAGAYGASASPSAFLGQGPAAEMLV